MVAQILTTYFFLVFQFILQTDATTCAVDYAYRVPCGKVNITRQECEEVYCCYDTYVNECFHYLPSKYEYLKQSTTDAYVTSQHHTPFHRKSFEHLSFQRYCKGREYSFRVTNKIEAENGVTEKSNLALECDLTAIDDRDKLSIDVFRNLTGERLLTTSLGPLIASEYYWEWTMLLTAERLWGLGEIEFPKNASITKIIYKNKDDHSTIPKFMAYLNGSYYGVQIETSVPLEITVLPSFLVILRMLDSAFFTITVTSGPTPADVVRQLYKSDRVYTPPYWSFGPHICREGNTNINSMIKEYREWREITKGDIEYASDCLHEDLYLHLFEASDSELKEIKGVLGELQNHTYFLMSFPPMIPVSNTNIYNMSLSLKMLYENETSGLLYGTYHGKKVVYPQHFPKNSWSRELLKIVPTENLAGYVLTSNWPVMENYTFVDDGTFPYLNDGLKKAFSGTIPCKSESIFGTHLLRHNEYGFNQNGMFSHSNTIDEPIIMMSSFHYVPLVDAANVQNVNISWTDLKRVYNMALSNSLFGPRLISIPVCGDTKYFDPKIHEKVCMRWYIMAASMPIFRISSDLPRRDPHSLPSRKAYLVAKDAIEKRRSLQPYFFSSMRTMHIIFAKPLMRPMFYDFYFDKKTFDYNEQYMVGDALLMAQPFSPGNITKSIYLPPSVGIWYDFWSGKVYKKLGEIQINIGETDWITFIAGGKIVPMRNHDGNSTNRDSLSLVIALNCTDGSPSCNSSGILYSKYYKITLNGNSTGVIIGNLNEDTRKDFGCHDNDTCNNCPNVIKTVKVYGLGDASNIFTKNVSLCTEIEGDEIYFTYK